MKTPLSFGKRSTGKLSLVLSLFLFFTLTLPFVSAFGVTSPFWETNPLVLSPGGTAEFSLELQNMVGGEDLVLRASIVEGAEFTTILGENLNFLVPFGTKDVKVPLRITLPQELPTKDLRVGISFRQVQENQGQMVQMSSSVRTSIPILIEEPEPKVTESPPEAQPSPALFLTIGSIMLFIIAVLLAFVLSFFTAKRRNS